MSLSTGHRRGLFLALCLGVGIAGAIGALAESGVRAQQGPEAVDFLIGRELIDGEQTLGDEAPRAGGERVDDPGVELGPRLPSLERLSLTFIDPRTFESFRAEGPFRFVAWHGDGVLELMGHDRRTGANTPMWLETRGDEVWVRVEVRGVEFVARLE